MSPEATEASRLRLPPRCREAITLHQRVFHEDGRRARYAIEMFPLLRADKRRGHALIPATHDIRLREVVETFGKYFKQELGFDSVPFVAQHGSLYASDPTVEVVLFDAQRVEATFPFAAGAAGLSVQDGEPWLNWFWIHPSERDKGPRQSSMGGLGRGLRQGAQDPATTLARHGEVPYPSQHRTRTLVLLNAFGGLPPPSP